MRPEKKSQLLLGVSRSKAKMLEFSIPEEHHIKITQDPAKLFSISIGLLGDLAAAINREEPEANLLTEMKTNLLFSASFFDSYLQSKLNETLDPYLMLLGAASYYLCELPGSSSVLIKKLKRDIDASGIYGLYCPNLDGAGLEFLLLWLLEGDSSIHFENIDSVFGKLIENISKELNMFFSSGNDFAIRSEVKRLRDLAYFAGTPRQLLLSDLISSIILRKIDNSTWKCLPKYSGLSISTWKEALHNNSFIKEFWPAQHLLGQANVLRGKSAIVQMPTSAGKTKATELILRSAFLAKRVSLAIIIAPFRALCHEIKNSLVEAFNSESTKVDELTDALQTDFEIAELLGHQQVLVVTPEKLLYALRHAPELGAHIGLLILDEGHQFDSGTRGITYELLLTSLRTMIPEGTQKVLISAVISNAEAVGLWLNGEPNVVEGTTLIPTFRSIGFASWLDQLGRIEYVDSRNAEQSEFFVPRVIETFNLGRKSREHTDRFFPEKNDGQAIALYLGLKLAPKGSIAIFCGRKSTAASICEKAVDVIKRGVPLPLPSDYSDHQEVARLTHLHIKNLGANAPASQSAEHGIFSHHGNTPHGIRLAVEHAMRDNLVRFVVCTSTLAQGVNLPIRYLIVTSVYQGMERIKVRDFHNLIGRAGRAGMHTEGSILFADPVIFDKRKVRSEKWRWKQVKKLLEPQNSEPCVSNLLSIFDPIKSDDEKISIPMGALDFAKDYIDNPDKIANLATKITALHGDRNFSQNNIERQIAWRISLISAVESFLLSHWDESEDGLSQADVTRLTEGTLAFFLADTQKKEHIRELFQLLARYISTSITEPSRRKIYGRTLYGIQDAESIEKWVQSNTDNLLSIVDEKEILNHIWQLFIKHINSGVFTKFDEPEVLKEISYEWISGKPFCDLLEIIRERKVKMIWGTNRREFKIDHIVDICEGALAYDATLVVGAISEFIGNLNKDGTRDLLNRLQLFQKRLKYGLPTHTAISLYELGFSDRVIAQDLATSLKLAATQKKYLVKELKNNRGNAMKVIEKYPMYFQEKMSELIEDF
ncbi:DEAD/DEAH box helicase [Escherichia coli]|uniref:DEAD/DEAH box helicase n=1 Tax=Escherichia coli TaxID=562 RepID=UPI00187F3DC4|nr:DEAD/DEAH box helicase [Escherichia coli]MBE8933361.1 DEAD/DEAH box helicase [Escherichia coli]HCN4607676.1 DEAD/DEAH box helicase [Escherichia coli]HCN5528242.1 DEAD/DEAH box helicase [Escherichia coli]